MNFNSKDSRNSKPQFDGKKIKLNANFMEVDSFEESEFYQYVQLRHTCLTQIMFKCIHEMYN